MCTRPDLRYRRSPVRPGTPPLTTVQSPDFATGHGPGRETPGTTLRSESGPAITAESGSDRHSSGGVSSAFVLKTRCSTCEKTRGRYDVSRGQRNRCRDVTCNDEGCLGRMLPRTRRTSVVVPAANRWFAPQTKQISIGTVPASSHHQGMNRQPQPLARPALTSPTARQGKDGSGAVQRTAGKGPKAPRSARNT